MGNVSTNASRPDRDRFLSTLGPEYERELITESAIDPDVAAERGYRALLRPRVNYDNSPIVGIDSREFLARLGFPTWATRENYYFPGLWLPGWDVDGRRTPGQWKPRNPVPDRNGRRMKYATAKGSSARLDVHPRWTRDRGADDPALLPYIKDVAEPLWITEGIKKADSLTSRGVCTIALSGVYNWRNSHGTLGDWENVPLKGREVTICFDADALVKPDVAQAMARIGRWLVSKGAGKVWYLVVPGEVSGYAVKGVDDYFAAGGTLKYLEQQRATKPPAVRELSDAYTDARMAERFAHEVLDGAYFFIPTERGAGVWYAYDGRRWIETSEIAVTETARVWALDEFAAAAADLKAGKDGAEIRVDGWRPLLSANKLRTMVSLARGVPIVLRSYADLDADPDLLNTPSGVVHLPTRDLRPHSPEYLMTKITAVPYDPDADTSAWVAALSGVMPAEIVPWLQRYIGQAATGHQMDGGRTLFMTGKGNAGKTMVAGSVFAVLGGHVLGGGYAAKVPSTLLLATKGGGKGAATPEKMTLRGTRFAYIEETPEAGILDANALKEIQDAEVIEGRELYRGYASFVPSHTLIINTNHAPVVTDTEFGTWRRLARLDFSYRFVPEGQPLVDERDRRADPRVKRSMSTPAAQAAILKWIVDGAADWYAHEQVMGPDPGPVAESVGRWRMDSDVLLRYLAQRCEFVPDSCVSSTVLHADFLAWLQGQNHAGRWTQQTLTTRLKDHSGLPGPVRQQSGVRFASVNVSMPPVVPGASLMGIPRLPNQGAAWWGLRFKADPEG